MSPFNAIPEGCLYSEYGGFEETSIEMIINIWGFLSLCVKCFLKVWVCSCQWWQDRKCSYIKWSNHFPPFLQLIRWLGARFCETSWVLPFQISLHSTVYDFRDVSYGLTIYCWQGQCWYNLIWVYTIIIANYISTNEYFTFSWFASYLTMPSKFIYSGYQTSYSMRVLYFTVGTVQRSSY